MIVKRKLSNGIEVIMEKIPYVRSVSIGIWVRTGSVNENDEISGISHFLEHMLFKGTDKRTAKDIAGDIDKIGGQINAFTGKESTCYYVKVLDTHISKGVEVLTDILFHSKFDPSEIAKEKTVVYEEINMYEDSPEDTVHDLLSEIVFDGHPLGRPIIGKQEIIESFSRETLLNYFKKNYNCENIVISAAGNINEEDVMTLLENNIVDCQGNRREKLPDIPTYKPDLRIKKKDIEQAHLCMGIKGIPLDDDKYYALSILSNIMGGSMSSRLFQKIREEKGLAYSVYSYTTSYVDDGVFAFYAGVNPKQLKETSKLMIEEINLLKSKGISKEELITAKEQLKGNYILSLESVSGRMASIGRAQLLLGKFHTPDEVIDNIDKVTEDEMNTVISLVTDLDNYSAAVVSREEVHLDQLTSILKVG